MSAADRLEAAPESGVPEPPSAAHGAGAQGAPEAPVARPDPDPGAIALEATFARHTGPLDATFGDPLRLFAVWAVRAASRAEDGGDGQPHPVDARLDFLAPGSDECATILCSEEG